VSGIVLSIWDYADGGSDFGTDMDENELIGPQAVEAAEAIERAVAGKHLAVLYLAICMVLAVREMN
jgi:hypothetical protein